MTNKESVLLNYGLMLQSVVSEIKSSTNFMSRFFLMSPELNTDPDLVLVGRKFKALLESIKELDNTLDNIGNG